MVQKYDDHQLLEHLVQNHLHFLFLVTLINQRPMGCLSLLPKLGYKDPKQDPPMVVQHNLLRYLYQELLRVYLDIICVQTFYQFCH